MATDLTIDDLPPVSTDDAHALVEWALGRSRDEITERYADAAERTMAELEALVLADVAAVLESEVGSETPEIG